VQLLAQIGSWVPAKQAKDGMGDRIFTSAGAVDDLATDQSTFIDAMAQTANILIKPVIIRWCYWMKSAGVRPTFEASRFRRK